MEQKFYICKHCGNIIAKVKDAGVPVICCGEPMSEIVPGTTDAAVEAERCVGCGKCAKLCPVGCIEVKARADA